MVNPKRAPSFSLDHMPSTSFFAFEVDGEGVVDGAVGDLAFVADFDDDGIEIDDGVDGIERAGLPGFDFLDDGIGGVSDQGGG